MAGKSKYPIVTDYSQLKKFQYSNGEWQYRIHDIKASKTKYYKVLAELGGKETKSNVMSQRFQKMFGKDFKPNATEKWQKPLRYGKGNKNFHIRDYKIDGMTYTSRDRWGRNYGKAKGQTPIVKQMNGDQFVRHLFIAKHQVLTNIEGFRMAVLNRALEVFRTSFRTQKFHTQGSSKWKPLAPATIAKRIRKHKKKVKGTPEAESNPSLLILLDTEKLYNSIEITNGQNPQIKTKPVENGSEKKCYGGFHNEGYGVPQRQFMGHSSYLDMTDPQISQLLTRYLFDDVFLNVAEK